MARPKTENSVRQVSIPQEAADLPVREHATYLNTPWLFPSSRTGGMYHPDSAATLRAYTHTTRQKQDEAAQTMGNLMAQVR